jgi:hypothetical protein
MIVVTVSIIMNFNGTTIRWATIYQWPYNRLGHFNPLELSAFSRRTWAITGRFIGTP